MFDQNYYKGILLQQHFNYKRAFAELFHSQKPKRMLEIGTGRGGLTLFLRDLASQVQIENFQIRTFDPLVVGTHDDLAREGIVVERVNIFDHNYSKLVKPGIVMDYIQEPGLTLVLCDGGCKKTEFNEIAPLIKSGDIIMCHDYIVDKQTFLDKFHTKIWNWHEVCYNDIKSACENNGLEPFMEERFANIVWFCSRKK